MPILELGLRELMVTWMEVEMILGAETLSKKMVASWRMNRGFLGWRMAQTMRTTRRMMKLKIRKPAQHCRMRFLRLSLWRLHFSTAMAVAVAVVVAVAVSVDEVSKRKL